MFFNFLKTDEQHQKEKKQLRNRTGNGRDIFYGIIK